MSRVPGGFVVVAVMLLLATAVQVRAIGVGPTIAVDFVLGVLGVVAWFLREMTKRLDGVVSSVRDLGRATEVRNLVQNQARDLTALRKSVEILDSRLSVESLEGIERALTILCLSLSPTQEQRATDRLEAEARALNEEKISEETSTEPPTAEPVGADVEPTGSGCPV